jgi:cellobiose phosphorylase
VEKILGLQCAGNTLRVEPCIPAHWREYEIHYRFGETVYHLLVENPQGAYDRVLELTLDGVSLNPEKIHLTDDGLEHHVLVTLGRELEDAQPEKRKGASGDK